MSRLRGVQRPHGRLLRQLRRVPGLVRLHTDLEHALAHDTGAARTEHVSGPGAVGPGHVSGARAVGAGHVSGAGAARTEHVSGSTAAGPGHVSGAGAVGAGHVSGAGAARTEHVSGSTAAGPGHTCGDGAVGPVLGASVRSRHRPGVRRTSGAGAGARRAHPHLIVARPAERPRPR
ncbi:hypothetical protein [Streptomyces sp. NPDC017958]|uniref:hypothetical protein n=1 Tax=Streptomyces sp. NPDC017958 TaxID=3365021 RepID=UPI00379990D1